MLRARLLVVLILAPALVGLAALPTSSAHVCIEGTGEARCSTCPDWLGLYHYHPDNVAGIYFYYGYCVLP